MQNYEKMFGVRWYTVMSYTQENLTPVLGKVKQGEEG